MDPNRVFSIHEDSSSDVMPLGVISKLIQLNLSNSLSCSSLRTRFGFEPIQLCNSILYFEGTVHISSILSLSFGKSKETYNLLGYSFNGLTWSMYSQSGRFMSESISTPNSHLNIELSQ